MATVQPSSPTGIEEQKRRAYSEFFNIVIQVAHRHGIPLPGEQEGIHLQPAVEPEQIELGRDHGSLER